MNKQRVAEELVKVAKDLVAADTFKCPDCGSKVLEQTKYCVKCKKKVKKAKELTAGDEIKISSAIDWNFGTIYFIRRYRFEGNNLDILRKSIDDGVSQIGRAAKKLRSENPDANIVFARGSYEVNTLEYNEIAISYGFEKEAGVELIK